MAKIHESRMDVDCIWTVQKPEVEPTHLIVYHQEEHGSATALTGKAIIGDAQPIACLYGKLMEVPQINFIPTPAWVGYRLYETRSTNGDRFWVLRIPKLHPVTISPNPAQSNVNWLYTYPIVRDIILILNHYGVNKLTYMTSNLFAMHPDFQHTTKLEAGHVATFDFASAEDEIKTAFGIDETLLMQPEFALAPNVWIWCDLFCNFCFEHEARLAEVLLGSPSPVLLDVDCADSLLNHLQTHYKLPYDPQALREMTQALKHLADERFVRIDLEDEQDEFDMTGFEE